MTDIPLRTRILDISLNLARIGNWTADNYEQKQKLIGHFLRQTEAYILELKQFPLSNEMNTILQVFEKEFNQFKSEQITQANKDSWAERALTWANILQHRAKFT